MISRRAFLGSAAPGAVAVGAGTSGCVAARPDFAGLVVGDGLRIVAPGHGIDAGLFSANYYDPCIEAVWSKALRAHGRPPRRS